MDILMVFIILFGFLAAFIGLILMLADKASKFDMEKVMCELEYIEFKLQQIDQRILDLQKDVSVDLSFKEPEDNNDIVLDVKNSTTTYLKDV